MAKTTTLPLTQNSRIAIAHWTNGSGTIFKALQVGGADYSGGSNDAILKALTVTNTTTGTAPTFLFGVLDPSAPTISVSLTASSTTAATGVTTSGGPPGVTDTTALGNYMLLTGSGTLAPGSFISSISSSSAFTLSKATTGSSPTGVVAIPWNILGSVTVPVASGGAAAGTTVNVDLLGSAYVTGFPLDQSGRPIVHIPTGFKIICIPLTVPAANNGYYTVTAQIEEF